MCIGRLHMILFLKMWVAVSAAGGNTIPNSTPDLCSCKFILLICLFVLARTGTTLESILFLLQRRISLVGVSVSDGCLKTVLIFIVFFFCLKKYHFTCRKV